MGYASLRACVEDLQRTGELRIIEAEIDPHLEAAEIQRRTYAAGGPALYFANVKGSEFPMVSNLFGTLERARYLFRDALSGVRSLIELKADPGAALKRPWRYLGIPLTALHALPRRVSSGPVFRHETRVGALPQLVSWPDDGGAFVTLPQVYTEDPEQPGPMTSNLGMYRVQLSGGRYTQDREVGLHYQIHRGIGVHHTAAVARGERLRVNVFVGGPPAMSLAAVMPLPEGLPELAFAGALGRRRPRMAPRPDGVGPQVHVDADFCISGYVEPGHNAPEGPFGDHLGYYSLVHDFPVLTVEHVYHRPGAVWPFTAVGRPPQEDTTFGALIHELTGPVIPTVLPGVDAVHAVDATGVHPLLLAVGSERYTPYDEPARPQELLTQANAILGQGQMSLAKYLIIVARGDAPDLDIEDVQAVLMHALQRLDPARDLHFHTATTIDTLDYSGSGLNQGSKLVLATVGAPVRELITTLPADLALPDGFHRPHVCMPGVLAVEARSHAQEPSAAERYCQAVEGSAASAFPLIVLCDDAEFCARTLDNFLWVTFTRSNPAVDVHGVGGRTVHKHWGCTGSLVIDARTKAQHAPPLIEDRAVSARVDALAAKGQPLHGIF